MEEKFLVELVKLLLEEHPKGADIDAILEEKENVLTILKNASYFATDVGTYNQDGTEMVVISVCKTAEELAEREKGR